MSGPLTDDEVARIATHMADVLTQKKRAQWVDPKTHHDHHTWIERRQGDERERREFRQRIIQSLIAWAMPLALGFVCLAMWKYFVAGIQAAIGGGL